MIRKISPLLAAGLFMMLMIVGPAHATNSTPSSHDSWLVEPWPSLPGLVDEVSTTTGQQGYMVRCDVNATLETIGDQLYRRNGVIAWGAHGSTDGMALEWFGNDDDAEEDQKYWYHYLIDNEIFFPDEIYRSEVPGEGYSLSVTEFFVSRRFYSAHSMVFIIGCQGFNWAPSAFGAANTVLGYTTEATVYTANTDIVTIMKRMNGWQWQNKKGRDLKTAYSGTSLSLSGDSNMVLAPTVSRFSPISGNLSKATPGYVIFDCPLDTSYNANTVVHGDGYLGYCAASNQRWTSAARIDFTLTPCDIGPCSWVVKSLDAYSADCFWLRLDGDGYGPSGDNFSVSMNSTSSTGCVNTVCAFEGASAWRDSAGLHVGVTTAGENGTQYLRIYGGKYRQTILGTLPASPSAEQNWKETTIASADSIFEIVEVTADGEGSSCAAKLRPQPPSNLADLRTTNQRLAMVPNQLMMTPGQLVDSDGGNTSYPVTNLIVWMPSNHPELRAAIQPVLDWYQQHWNWSGQIITGSSDPNEVRSVVSGIWHRAMNEKFTGKMHLILYGEANQGYDPSKNLIGTFYGPDPFSQCLMGTCVSDWLMGDCDGDSIPDVTVSRIPINTLAQANYTTTSALEYLNASLHPSSGKAIYIQDGDAVNLSCTRVPESTSLTEELRAQYQSQGFTTILKHQSSYPDCQDFDRIQADATSVNNSTDLAEIDGTSQYTNRSIMVFWRKIDVLHPFTADDLTRPQRLIACFPGCDIVDPDRNNPNYYPIPAVDAFRANPANHTTFVAVCGNSRAGYWPDHLQYFRTLFFKWKDPNKVKTLDEAVWNTVVDLAQHNITPVSYALGIADIGWPMPLPGSQGVVGVDSPPDPGRTDMLMPNVPNPFRSKTVLRFGIASLQYGSLAVYDINGRRIKVLVPRHGLYAGTYTVTWDGTNDAGQRMSAGVYFARLEVGQQHSSRKLQLVP